jgi:hypothetical protein
MRSMASWLIAFAVSLASVVEAKAGILLFDYIDAGQSLILVPIREELQIIPAGSFLLLFDVGSVALNPQPYPPGNWLGSVEFSSDTAGFPIDDDPLLPNVRFVYEGPDPIGAPISELGEFSITKSSEGIFAPAFDYIGYAQDAASGALVYNTGVATVVPEPSTLALLALGLSGLARIGRGVRANGRK